MVRLVKMAEHPQPSPIRYFAAARAHRRRALGVVKQDCGELEKKVVACFVVIQETALHLANAAVTNGVTNIERYLPSMHEALLHLQQFRLSLIIAPCYGAYTWPNVELKAFAHSLADIGIDMRWADEIEGNGKKAIYPQTGTVGVALLQKVHEIQELASSAYFFGEDLTAAFKEGRRRLNHAEDIFNELFTQALSAKALKDGYRPQTNELVKLVNFVLRYRLINM